ncbi:MAG: ubiquitin-like small modifier protein 1 [Methanoregulaceae archaeon]
MDTMTKISVRIRLFAQFREQFGGAVPLSLETGSTLLDALNELAAGVPDGRKAFFEDDGGVREYVVLMRNGKRIETTEAAATQLAEGDELAIFPPVAGG